MALNTISFGHLSFQVLKAFNNPDFFNKAFPQLFDMCSLQINTTSQNNLSSDLRGGIAWIILFVIALIKDVRQWMMHIL